MCVGGEGGLIGRQMQERIYEADGSVYDLILTVMSKTDTLVGTAVGVVRCSTP